MTILTLNAGSNSLKFEIVAAEGRRSRGDQSHFGSSLISGAYDNIGKDDAAFSLLEKKRPVLPTRSKSF
jgi:acetate kinase